MFDAPEPTTAVQSTGGLIGPNAVLQLLPVLQHRLGTAAADALLREAQIAEVPDGTAMIDEAMVARLHQALRRSHPEEAPVLAIEAGRRTADYIIANRIPAPARVLLRLLPAALAEPLLLQAVTQHSWTFAGSGTFAVVARHPTRLEVRNNPVVRGEHASEPVCGWHAAVFARLYEVLVGKGFSVRETRCAATGGEACCFEVTRSQGQADPVPPT